MLPSIPARGSGLGRFRLGQARWPDVGNQTAHPPIDPVRGHPRRRRPLGPDRAIKADIGSTGSWSSPDRPRPRWSRIEGSAGHCGRSPCGATAPPSSEAPSISGRWRYAFARRFTNPRTSSALHDIRCAVRMVPDAVLDPSRPTCSDQTSTASSSQVCLGQQQCRHVGQRQTQTFSGRLRVTAET